MSRPLLIFLGPRGAFEATPNGSGKGADLLRLGFWAVAGVRTFEEAAWLREKTCDPSGDEFLFRGFGNKVSDYERMGQELEGLWQAQFGQPKG